MAKEPDTTPATARLSPDAAAYLHNIKHRDRKRRSTTIVIQAALDVFHRLTNEEIVDILDDAESIAR